MTLLHAHAHAQYIYIMYLRKISDGLSKKVNRKVQEEPQAEAAANPRHQEEEKKWQSSGTSWFQHVHAQSEH